MSREAAAAGVSGQVIASAFAGITHDPAVMAFDRRQRYTFRKSFEEYARTRVTEARLKRASTLMARHARVFLEFGALTWPNGCDIAPEWLRRGMAAAGELTRETAE
jgi:hypothetical protein